MNKLVTVAITVLIISARAQQGFAAGEPEPSAARLAPAPGDTRFVTRGGETVEGKIIDRLPNGYLVRSANMTQVVAYENVATIEGEGSAPPPSPAVAPPPQVQTMPPPVVPLAFVPGPPANASESFGRAGQVIVTQGFGYVHHSGNTTTIFLDPAFNFLVTDMLTLGFEVEYARSSTSSGGEGSTTRTSTEVGGLGMIGLVARLSDTVSLWPNLGGGISHDFDGEGSSTVIVGGQLALLLHPARHFFIGVGPEIRGVKSLEGSGQSFHYSQALASMIGGWW